MPKDNSIDIFDLNLNQVKTITSETKPTGLVFSPDGKLLLAGVCSRKPVNCNIYDTRNNFKKITSFKKHDNLTRAVAFLDNSTVITGGGDNYDIYLWDAYTGEEKAHIAGDGNTVCLLVLMVKRLPLVIVQEKIYITMISNSRKPSILTPSVYQILKIPPDSDVLLQDTMVTNYATQRAAIMDIKMQSLVIKKGWRKIARIVRDAYDGYGHKTYGFTDDAVIISGGANGVLKAYNLKGKEIVDFIGHTGDVCSIATQGNWLVSGSADQTMILWDLRGIKKRKSKIYPTLNMFISKDDEWVVWSNKGYYNSSVDGDKYIGYHVNHGADSEACFYSSDKFFKTYYRPVIVKNLIKIDNEEKAIAYIPLMKKVEEVAVADILPPVIRLNIPQSNYINTTEDYIKVDFTVIPQSKHRITETTILVNGRPLGDRGMDVVEKKGENNIVKDIPLSGEYNRISLIAGNSYARSEEVIIEVSREKAADENIYKPDLYVLSIGVSEYENRDLNLKYADNDARGIVDVFKAQEGKLFNKVKCTLLLNNESTRGNILDGIDWLDRETTQKDVAVLFIAGHGLNDDKGSYYFLGHDVDPKRLRRTAVKWKDFEGIVKTLPSKVILLADTCHSGGTMGEGGTMNNNITKAIKELVSTGREQVIMTAATGGSYSLDKDKWMHGAFTKAILEGLGELRADYDMNSLVSIKELDLYVTKRVKELTKGKQKPTTIIPEPLPDFPIVSS